MTEIPPTLTLEEAFRAAFYLTDLWLSLEKEPCEGLVLFHQYLQSDPARWDDWKDSIRRALEDAGYDPLRENIGPLD